MELDEAEVILAICDRFKALPSQVLAEDTTIMRLLRIEHHGKRQEEGGDPGELG